MIANTPTIRINLDAVTPIYQQIAAALRSVLVAGRLGPGDRLPTVRQLATDLGVHHNTVAEAYRALAAEGWLDLRRRRGATVLARPSPTPTSRSKADLARGLAELVAKALAEGIPPTTIAAALAEAVRIVGSEEGS